MACCHKIRASTTSIGQKSQATTTLGVSAGAVSLLCSNSGPNSDHKSTKLYRLLARIAHKLYCGGYFRASYMYIS